MLWLNSKTDRPDFNWFKTFLESRSAQGIRVKVPSEKVRVASRLASEAADWLRDNCGIDNPNSPKQVVDYMMSVRDSNIDACCTVRGKLSSAQDGLIGLAELGYKWAMQLIKYRTNANLVKNVSSVMGCADGDNLVHPEISLQKTNRISYKAPALMNISKEVLWDMIQPMYENDYLWSVDIRNQEPWILAHMTGAKKLIELAEKASDSGSSMYKAVYMDIFGHEIESEEAYDEMKRAWNMLTYGGTLQGLLPRCKVINAETVFNYFKNIKELSDYRGRTFGLAKKMVQSATTVFGTTVFTDAVGGHLQRSLMDIPIQGTGADILCLITQRIEAELSDMFGGESPIRIYFTRHDELIFDVDRGWQDENGSDTVKGLLKDVCSHRIDDWTAFGLDVEQLN